MSFKRQNDKNSKRSSRVISDFGGAHYGLGKTDQPDRYCFGSDFHFLHKKPWLRPGCRKNQHTGYPATISSLFFIGIGGNSLVASVANGQLSTYLRDDYLDGVRQYWTVGEVAGTFTASGLTVKTVNQLIHGG